MKVGATERVRGRARTRARTRARVEIRPRARVRVGWGVAHLRWRQLAQPRLHGARVRTTAPILRPRLLQRPGKEGAEGARTTAACCAPTHKEGVGIPRAVQRPPQLAHLGRVVGGGDGLEQSGGSGAGLEAGGWSWDWRWGWQHLALVQTA